MNWLVNAILLPIIKWVLKELFEFGVKKYEERQESRRIEKELEEAVDEAKSTGDTSGIDNLING